MGSIRTEDHLESFKENESLYFHILNTLDGSYSASTSTTPEMNQESMHSSQGAFTETEYIYGEAISFTLNKISQPTFLNLGLGIGYNELSVFCRMIKESIPARAVNIISYEIHPELNKYFVDYLAGRLKHSFLQKAYDNVFSHYLEKYNFSKDQISSLALEMLDKDRWVLKENILEDENPPSDISCFLFDAYSKASSAELWTTDFLNYILKRAADKSVFTTYAATGDLNRALRANNFWVHARAGFAFKRQSTWALKGLDRQTPSDLLD